ncbi:MAG TPA: protein-glutamate O-methyltransferase CheR [Stellaceae bacterium]|nr:protein-glutamate O-methyltransferase CheR [Stellaceae bacterium]
MSEPIKSHNIEQFRAAIAAGMGLLFDDARVGFLGEVLQRRVDRSGLPAQVYLSALAARADKSEQAALARELTVGETYFFRNHEQFAALAEIAVPDRMRANAASRTLRLLSAGCASGEEPYTLAIVAREWVADPAWTIKIRATDINPAALERAERGRYSTWALRETPASVQARWFHPAGRELLLDDSVRQAVRFDERNLAVDDAELWQPGSLDIVFCRNVIMYFAPDQARALIERIVEALQPGGYLFLGHAETLRGLSDDFHLKHTHGTFYYQRKAELGQADPPRAAFVGSPARVHEATALDENWIDLIRQASERVAALTATPCRARPHTPAAPAVDLVRVLELMRSEQFAEALALLRALPAASGRDPETLLLEAMLLAHSGSLPAAEDTCKRLLAIDELNAGAHYVFALCRESAADRTGAAEHDRVAVYLDPAFAMPRLHLGLMARRAGDRGAARSELAQAVVLLKREDASRLLLFGGGFNREALLTLAESALRDCGGAP